MRLSLESTTDVACHALFDPAVTGALDHEVVGDDWFEEAKRGTLLPVNTAADGRLGIQVLLDEPLPDEWARRANQAAKSFLLRVPGGRLVMSGLEYVADAHEVGKALPFEPGRYAGLTYATVPAGNYEVDVFVLSWDERRELEPRLKERLGLWRTFESIAGPLSGFLFFVGLLGSIGALVYLAGVLVQGKAPSWLISIPPLLVASGFLLGKTIETSGILTARREVEAGFPGVVAVLRQLPESADLSSRQGGPVSLWEAVEK